MNNINSIKFNYRNSIEINNMNSGKKQWNLPTEKDETNFVAFLVVFWTIFRMKMKISNLSLVFLFSEELKQNGTSMTCCSAV